MVLAQLGGTARVVTVCLQVNSPSPLLKSTELAPLTGIQQVTIAASLKSHSRFAFIGVIFHSSMRISIQDSLKPIQAGMTLPLVREPRPAQYALGGSALEWQGYRQACARMQQIAADQESIIKGPELRSEPIVNR